jgi:hypothetical protein
VVLNQIVLAVTRARHRGSISFRGTLAIWVFAFRGESYPAPTLPAARIMTAGGIAAAHCRCRAMAIAMCASVIAAPATILMMGLVIVALCGNPSP